MPKVETITIADVEFEALSIRRRSGEAADGSPVHQVILEAVVNIIDDSGDVVRQENHSTTFKVTGENPNRTTRWTTPQIRSALNKTFDSLLADLRQRKAGIPKD